MSDEVHKDRAGYLVDGRFRTTEIYLAAALATLDYDLLGLEKEKDRYFFVFAVESIADFEQTLTAWDLDTLTVLAASYAEKIKRLKNAVMRGR